MSRARRLPKVLSADEQARFLSQFNTRWPTPHRSLCMVRLMLEAGLRVGEVVALRPEHLDMRTCRLMVREGKGAKDRVLWITDDSRDLIGAWLNRRPDSPWLFPTRDGGRVSTRYMREMVKRSARKAGVAEWERLSPHSLRHTFATDLLNATGNIRLVQKALGHASVATTQLYCHVADGELEEALRHGGTVAAASGEIS
jgi:site-specific recombinase XerD